MTPKPIAWVGRSRVDMKQFPRGAREQVGHDLWLVQNGCAPRDWRPMAGVGPGVVEIRIHTAREHRVLYVAHFDEAIYVLHAFEKRSRKTGRRDLDTARARYRDLVRIRARERPT